MVEEGNTLWNSYVQRCHIPYVPCDTLLHVVSLYTFIQLIESVMLHDSCASNDDLWVCTQYSNVISACCAPGSWLPCLSAIILFSSLQLTAIQITFGWTVAKLWKAFTWFFHASLLENRPQRHWGLQVLVRQIYTIKFNTAIIMYACIITFQIFFQANDTLNSLKTVCTTTDQLQCLKIKSCK